MCSRVVDKNCWTTAMKTKEDSNKDHLRLWRFCLAQCYYYALVAFDVTNSEIDNVSYKRVFNSQVFDPLIIYVRC